MDIIETHNIPNQVYGLDNNGKFKVACIHKICEDLGSRVTTINAYKNKVTEDNAAYEIKGTTCFCLVDSMSARKELFYKIYNDNENVRYWIETRMGLTGYRIYLVDLNNDTEVEKYAETLYSDEDAEVSACGASQSVVTTAMQCASHAVGLWLALKNNAEYIPNEIIFDVHSSFIMSRKFDKKEEEKASEERES